MKFSHIPSVLTLSFAACLPLTVIANDHGEVDPVTPRQHDPFRIGAGVAVGEETFIGDVQLLAPLWTLDREGNVKILLSPRFSQMDGGLTTGSLGLGLRSYLPDLDIVLGGFLFYDYFSSGRNNSYHQGGFGLEAFTPHLTLRGNYYRPESNQSTVDSMQTTETSRSETVRVESEVGAPFGQGNQILQEIIDITERTVRTRTTSRFFDRFEAAMEGWDAEIGTNFTLAQIPGSFSVFGGYLRYANPFGSNIEGATARVGYAPVDLLEVGVEYYEDKLFLGDRWFATARVDIPLGGTGQSETTHRSELEREETRHNLFQQVRRSRKVTTAESGWIEDEARRRVTNTTQVTLTDQSRTEVLLSGVLFVDNVAGAPGGTGTFASPFDNIDDATQAAATGNVVYLRPGGPDYDNANLNRSVTIIGHNPFNVFPGAPANTNSVIDVTGSPAGILFDTLGPVDPGNRNFFFQGLNFVGAAAPAFTFDVQDGRTVNVTIRNVVSTRNATFDASGGSTLNVLIQNSTFAAAPATTFEGLGGAVTNFDLIDVIFGIDPPITTSGSAGPVISFP